LSSASLIAASSGHAEGAPVPPNDQGTVTPEAFGAKGDGKADDSAAIQRAFDSVAARPFGGVVVLQPRVAYRCRSGLVLDASHVSLWGQALLDFSESSGVCLRVTASSVASSGPAHNYGRKGMISGALHIRGGGRGTKTIGVHFDSDAVATSAQLLVENLAVSNCEIGVALGRRAYNSVFTRCEIFDCDVCIDWPLAEDSGERTTLLGCTLFNSGTAVRMTNPNAALYLLSCSLDYTNILYDVARGGIFATDTHHESSIWADCPIRCRGDGALVRMNGGWLVNQTQKWDAEHVVDVGDGADVTLESVILHNVVLASKDPAESSWAKGAGGFRIRDNYGFEFGPLPTRLHETRTTLADPDFAAADWQDPVWRIADTNASIASRTEGAGDNLRLSRRSGPNGTALEASKAHGTGSSASFVLMALPVRGDDQVYAGFHVRRDSTRPGLDGTVLVHPCWVRLDGHDANRIPIIARKERIGTVAVTPTIKDYMTVSPLASRRQRSAPSWATHFLMVIDLVQADRANFLFRGLWCDAT
jgi:hypothetical protein